jgi:N-formylglutamate deformylase
MNSHPKKPALYTYFPPLTPQTQAIVSIPHSGEWIPDEFKKFLTNDMAALNQDLDTKVDELIDIPALQIRGIGVLVAHIHRVCIDLNRSQENALLFWRENTQGQKIIHSLPDTEESEILLQKYWRPFFEIYKALLEDAQRFTSFPFPVVDLHSMPSSPTAYHLKQNPKQNPVRAAFCLSDQRGQTCDPLFIADFATQLSQEAYTVAINDPYVGGYVTQFVNQFHTNNIQIEIRRNIYMDESSRSLIKPLVEKLSAHLTQVLSNVLLKWAK